MTTPYTPNQANFNATITEITDNDEPSGSLFSTPLEQLADNALPADVYQLTNPSDSPHVYTPPAGARELTIICIGPGGQGGTSSGANGGGGGGSGAVKVVRMPVYAGMSLTCTIASCGGADSTVVDAAAFVKLACTKGGNGGNAGGSGGSGGAAAAAPVGGSAGAAGGAGGTGVAGAAGSDGYSANGGAASTFGHGLGAGQDGQDGSVANSGGGGAGGYAWVNATANIQAGAGAVIIIPHKGPRY